MTNLDAVVFDLGGVLVDWNPRYLFRKLYPNREAEMEHFLTEVCSNEWNAMQDAGRTWSEAVKILQQDHPEHAEMISAYHLRWEEMLAGAIEGTVAVLRDLKRCGTPLFALTNWSHETFPLARRRFEFLGWFDGVVVSGEEKLIKPDRRIFDLLLARFALDPRRTVYIDDNLTNVAAATEIGMHAIHFTEPDALRRELESLQLLNPEPAAGTVRSAVRNTG